jgi:hypothetical protein
MAGCRIDNEATARVNEQFTVRPARAGEYQLAVFADSRQIQKRVVSGNSSATARGFASLPLLKINADIEIEAMALPSAKGLWSGPRRCSPHPAGAAQAGMQMVSAG